jgi:hypothetical protein
MTFIEFSFEQDKYEVEPCILTILNSCLSKYQNNLKYIKKFLNLKKHGHQDNIDIWLIWATLNLVMVWMVPRPQWYNILVSLAFSAWLKI